MVARPMGPSQGHGAARVGVRAMVASDVAPAVAVHLAAFRGFFLSFLGERFVALFYSEVVRLGEIALVAEAEGQPVGFVVGSAAPDRFYRALLQHSALRFAWAAAPAVLRRPSVALRLVRAVRKPRESRRPPGTATLMSLGVSPTAQGLGVGGKLIDAFADAALARGAMRVDLTTDKLGNAAVNRFYQHAGFRLVRDYVTPEGRAMNQYELVLDRGPAPTVLEHGPARRPDGPPEPDPA